MNVSKMFPSKYAKAHDLPDSGVVVVMSHVKSEKMGQPPQDNWVLYFERATKGMVLNRTNAMTIASLYGGETDGWKGKRIRLLPAWVQAFGKNNHVIRVDDKAPPVPPTNGNNGHETPPDALNDREDMVDPDEDDGMDAPPEDYEQPQVDNLSTPQAEDEPEGTPIQKAIKLAESVYGRKYGPRFAELIRMVSDQKTSSPAELDAEQQEALLQALLLRRTLNLKGARKHGDGWHKQLQTRIRELSNNFMDSDSELTDEQVTVILNEL